MWWMRLKAAPRGARNPTSRSAPGREQSRLFFYSPRSFFFCALEGRLVAGGGAITEGGPAAAGHPCLMGGEAYGFCHLAGHAGIKDGRNDVVLTQFFFRNQLGDRVSGRELHGLIDGGRP